MKRRPLRALGENDMRGVGRGNVLGTLIAELRCIESGEEVLSAAEQDRRDGKVHLVDETRTQVLLDRCDPPPRRTSLPLAASLARSNAA
jgi:hypothetical protein